MYQSHRMNGRNQPFVGSHANSVLFAGLRSEPYRPFMCHLLLLATPALLDGLRPC
jgi:hypothetical protein